MRGSRWGMRGALAVTITLVLVSAGLSVLPPLLTQRAFDEGLFPPGGEPNVPVLLQLVGLMLLLWVISAGLGIALRHALRHRPLGDRAQDARTRVERGVGVLEDHLHPPPGAAQGVRIQRGHVIAECTRHTG